MDHYSLTLSVTTVLKHHDTFTQWATSQNTFAAIPSKGLCRTAWFRHYDVAAKNLQIQQWTNTCIRDNLLPYILSIYHPFIQVINNVIIDNRRLSINNINNNSTLKIKSNAQFRLVFTYTCFVNPTP